QERTPISSAHRSHTSSRAVALALASAGFTSSRDYLFCPGALASRSRSGFSRVPCPQVEELAARARAVRGEGRIRSLFVRELRLRDGILFGVAAQLFGGKPVGFRRVQSEHLCAQRRRHRRIAVALLQFFRDLERAERLDLILRRAVPDRV